MADVTEKLGQRGQGSIDILRPIPQENGQGAQRHEAVEVEDSQAATPSNRDMKQSDQNKDAKT